MLISYYTPNAASIHICRVVGCIPPQQAAYIYTQGREMQHGVAIYNYLAKQAVHSAGANLDM